MKKGFTLIELLAVIIILAIVALIATPIILNVVEEARISAGRSEAQMIYSGINNYCQTEEMKYQLDNSHTKICTSSMTPDVVGQMVNLGNAEILEIAYGSSLIWLKIKSNNYIYSLQDGKMVEGDLEKPRFPASLISLLLEQYNELNTTGLVKDNTNENIYYYTGTNEEVSNNYLWYGGHHWRVVEFDTEANTLLLISQQPLTAITPASATWKNEEEYKTSYLNNWENDYFYNSLTNDIRKNIITNTFNIGIYTDVDEITTNLKVGFLDVTQYNRAGGQNSYLDIKDYWWTSNRYDASNFTAINYDGNIDKRTRWHAIGVRPVMKISDIIINNGEGTLESNYKTAKKTTNILNVQVGEYINVPYNGNDNACGADNKCTFRVVSKDNDSVKVVLNGVLSETSTFGTSGIISKDLPIYQSLDSFIKNIDIDYYAATEKKFYIGIYGSDNYSSVKNEEIYLPIGLPTIGEMFSGNDIDLSTSNTKTFVNVATIENPAVATYYWHINRLDSINIRDVSPNGNLHNNLGTGYKMGVRPVIFLKNNLDFTGGEGTAESPYELQ